MIEDSFWAEWKSVAEKAAEDIAGGKKFKTWYTWGRYPILNNHWGPTSSSGFDSTQRSVICKLLFHGWVQDEFLVRFVSVLRCPDFFSSVQLFMLQSSFLFSLPFPEQAWQSPILKSLVTWAQYQCVNTSSQFHPQDNPLSNNLGQKSPCTSRTCDWVKNLKTSLWWKKVRKYGNWSWWRCCWDLDFIRLLSIHKT